MASGLAGIQLKLIISDPWGFVTKVGSGPFVSHVLQVLEDTVVPGKKMILLKLCSGLVYKSGTLEYLVATPRHKGVTIESLLNGDMLSCGLIGIAESQARDNDRLDVSKWRGGIALIGTLQLISVSE